MKAPSFWYTPPCYAVRALAPLGKLYGLAGKARRRFVKPYQPKVPVLCVGNLTAGGAGKTPTALALLKLIKEQTPNAAPVFVTRGYGGKEKGPLRVECHHSFNDIGDEAVLLAKAAPCFVGRDRAAAIQMAEKKATHVLLDDGLQNPSFVPTKSILVIDGAVGFGNEALIPLGPLRESLKDALPRIDAVVLIGDDAHGLSKRMDKPVFRAHLKARMPAGLAGKKILAFAGIGRPEKFYQSCRDMGLIVDSTRAFPDHHVFSFNELQALEEEAMKKKLTLVTTAKDFVRLPPLFGLKVSVLEVALVFDREDEVSAFLRA